MLLDPIVTEFSTLFGAWRALMPSLSVGAVIGGFWLAAHPADLMAFLIGGWR